jgi:polysaccharide export outer membrane protein
MRRLVSVLMLVTTAVVPAAAAAQPAVPSGGAAAGNYRIGPEDTVLVSVWKNDAISRTVPVRPDGMISLPLLNDVQAAGLTPMELRDVLAAKLREFIPSPEVSVILTDVRSFKVSVIGEIARPGRYELKSWTTILDVLALAGGFTEFASRARIVVLRRDGSVIKRLPFNYNKVIGGSEQDNFYLEAGDIIFVP